MNYFILRKTIFASENKKVQIYLIVQILKKKMSIHPFELFMYVYKQHFTFLMLLAANIR